MRKRCFALVMAALLVVMTACGSAPEPEATQTPAETAAATEPAAQTEPKPTAPEVQLTVTGAEACLDAVYSLGYYEVYPDIYAQNIEKQTGATGASVTPTLLEVTESEFRMELDVVEYYYQSQKLHQTDGWMLYGRKDTDLRVIPDLESRGYELLEQSMLTNGTEGEIFSMADYTYVLWGEDGYADAMIYLTAAYYPATGNLYNVVQEFFSEPEEYGSALILVDRVENYPQLKTVETFQYDDFTVELRSFLIQCGDTYYFSQYRPGMSFSDWACSELNTEGFIPWYDDNVLSPDRKYIAGTGYLTMESLQEIYREENLVIPMEKFDGKMDHTYQYSMEVFGDASAMEYMKSEELEIRSNGNINVPVAHMVNARTPLFSPGFRTVGREEGRAAYHSVELGNGLFLLDDIIDIYMNEIDEALIPHIKLYAFPESEAFLETLGDQLILNAHTAPLPKDSEMLKIPEDAVCLSFQRVRDGQEAPDSPNPRRPGHENLNKNAVFARYVTKDDPNFAEGVNLVFAITYDEELVYWIHMGSNFHESNDVQWIVNAMGY